ncbi:MAG: DUF1599 domain-containing protein, partial [Oscillospiraceae bacterium]
MNTTLFQQFDAIMTHCFQVFQEKQADYGPTWLLYRESSLVDEIWRKGKRIRTLEEQDCASCIPEGCDTEYVGIINYCFMYLMRENPALPTVEESVANLTSIDGVEQQTLFDAYHATEARVRELLYRKNADYGDAWKSMSLHSMTDQVLIRIYRIKTILGHDGHCAVSEGVAAQLEDV